MSLADELLQAVKARNAARVEELLRADPNLIHLEGLVRTAAYSGASEVLQVILAQNPALDIFEAALVGDAARIRQLADGDPHLVHATDCDGFMALHLAAHYGRTDAVMALVEKGVDVNAITPSKVSFVPANTAMHAAIAGGPHMDVITYLMENGADLSKPDSHGETPLHGAAFHNGVELVAMLLARGVAVNPRKDGGKTPLGVALSRGNREVADLLVQHGGLE